MDERIARCKSTKPVDESGIDEIVNQTMAAIRNLAATLDGAPPATLRPLLSLLIARLAVDLETRDVELEICPPSGLNAEHIRMCLVEGFVCKSFNQTHRVNACPWGVFSLIWNKVMLGYKAIAMGSAA